MDRTSHLDPLAGTLLLAAVAAVSTAPQLQEIHLAAGARPSVTRGQDDVVAWRDATDGQVHIATVPGGASLLLGPRGTGMDGAPTMAAMRDVTWVAAARASKRGTQLWTRRVQRGRVIAIPQPRATANDHHPALAVGGGQVWLVWVGNDGLSAHEQLYASHLVDGAWSYPERLPKVPGTPMAPAIAVDDRGRAAVAWAASDGNDAEIWLTVRRFGGWSTPHARSRDKTPDLSPSIAAHSDGWLIAWTSYEDGFYAPVASLRSRVGWSRPARLSERPGTAPQAIVDGNEIAVLWAESPDPTNLGIPLRAAIHGPDGWGEPQEIAIASNARFAASARHGRTLIGWRDLQGELAAGSMPTRSLSRGRIRLRRLVGGPINLAPQASVPTTHTLVSPRLLATNAEPIHYACFGDSITSGTTRVDGVVIETDGYPAALGDLLDELLLRPSKIDNLGKGGEESAEGLNRLAGVLATSTAGAFLIQEGANDISRLLDSDSIVFNLRKMTEMSVEAGFVTLLGMLTPRNESGDSFRNNRINEVNKMLVNVARAKGVPLVDLHSPYFNNSGLFSDHIHPSADGYSVMAEVWFRTVRDIVIAIRNDADIDDALLRDKTLPGTPNRDAQTRRGC